MTTKLCALLAVLASWGVLRAEVYIVQDTPEPMAVLAAFLNQHGHRTLCEDQKQFRRHMQRIRPEAIFMYIHHVMDEDIETYLIQYARGGGRLIILHHGIASGRMKNPRWMEFLGMRILARNDPQRPWTVLRGNFELVQLSPQHQVSSRAVEYPKQVNYTPSDEPSAEGQFPAIELPDTELFFNQIFTDGRRKTVLLGMKGTIGGKVYMQDRAGWVLRQEKGWVFYFMPGHNARDFENRNYAQILLNAVEWQPEGR